jgi:hypothetical protein
VGIAEEKLWSGRQRAATKRTHPAIRDPLIAEVLEATD